MEETRRIADQLRRAFEGPAWHGPALREILLGVTAEGAAARPVPAAHSLWELVLHVAAWDGVVSQRLLGETIASLPPEQDFPPVRNTSEAAWREARERLERGQRALRETVASFAEHRLGETVPGKDYSYYVMLHGAVQHALYHAGQMAILKKGLLTRAEKDV